MFFGWFRRTSAPRPVDGGIPAWALVFRSPYRDLPAATSWLGGAPTVPAGFDWPTGRDGRPLHFVAQIDLAALKPEPMTGARAPGLPTEGALLVFVGEGYAVRVLSPRELSRATAATPSLPALSERGFWGRGSTFGRWPVEPVAYLSHGEERPAILPDPFATPQQWITTCGLAALEASLTHGALATELRLGREFMAFRRSQEALGRVLSAAPHIHERIAHCALMEDHAPGLLAALVEWQATVAARPAEAPVDGAALAAIFAQRVRLATAMKNNYGARPVLAGDAHAVWQKIVSDAPDDEGGKDLSSVPRAYRSFVEAKVTDWRGHRLFGVEPEFPNNPEDLRQQRPLISIAGDELLGTKMEHAYGFSVWLGDDDITRGRHASGQLVWHSSV